MILSWVRYNNIRLVLSTSICTQADQHMYTGILLGLLITLLMTLRSLIYIIYIQ